MALNGGQIWRGGGEGATRIEGMGHVVFFLRNLMGIHMSLETGPSNALCRPFLTAHQLTYSPVKAQSDPQELG